MDLDELLFGRIVKYLKKRKERQGANDPNRIVLGEIKPRLTILARAFTGRPIEIFEAEREGGFKNDNFFLPGQVSFFANLADNLGFSFFRIVYLSIQQQLNLNWQPSDPEESLEVAHSQARLSSLKVLQVMQSEYPEVYRLQLDLLKQYQDNETDASPDLTWFFGKWMKNEGLANITQRSNDLADQIRHHMNPKPDTTLKAKGIEEIKSLQVDTKQQEDYVMTHNFEKVETAEEFSGVWRDFDGDDELEKHEDALDELNLKFTVRVDDVTHSVYEADFIENTTIAESGELVDKEDFLYYPEWNYRKREYRDDFCKLFPGFQNASNIAYYHATIEKYGSILMGLRKQLVNINNKRQEQRRQNDGAVFDLDAITDLYADVFANRTPSDKIYLSSRKNAKDLSVLLLLDGSLSSDSYVLGNRVIDVEKEVSILFGEILNEFETDFSVAIFYSKTRNYSNYNILKDFSENWSQARYKIGAAQPNGYTRIGTALRHARAVLDKRATKNKWVILLSDGKPNDYDKYEGKYGIQDVKQSLRELYEHNINAYALAIEAQARYYLPQMFGQNHYQILHTPDALLKSMVHLFDKIRFHS